MRRAANSKGSSFSVIIADKDEKQVAGIADT